MGDWCVFVGDRCVFMGERSVFMGDWCVFMGDRCNAGFDVHTFVGSDCTVLAVFGCLSLIWCSLLSWFVPVCVSSSLHSCCE